MRLPLPSSIRANLILVVLAGVLPLLAVILASGWERRAGEIRDAGDSALRLVESLADRQEGVTQGIRQMLGALAALPAVGNLDAPACSALFRQFLSVNPNHGNIALVLPNGEALASAVPFSQASFADMKHFRDALETGEFSTGEYTLGRVSRVPALTFAQPVLDEWGRVAAVLSTSLRLEAFAALFDRARLPADSFVGISDHRGLRLLRHPAKDTNPPGEPIAPQVWARAAAVEKEAQFTSEGSDGVRRIYAIRRLRLGPDREPYLNIFVGIPESQAIARADAVTRDYLLWLAGSLLLSCGLAWVAGKYGILRRINRLVDVARRLGAGELSARSGLTESLGALGALAGALDHMAAALERDMAQLKQAEEALREREAKISGIFGAAPLGIGMVADRVLTEVNEAMCRMVGYTREELLGQDSRLLYPAREEYDYVGREMYRQIRQLGAGSVETRFRRKDGGVIHIHLGSAPLDGADLGKGVVFSALDITRRKLAEEALRESEERFRLLAEESPVSIMAFDRDGVVTFVSNWHLAVFTRNILGADHFLGRRIWDLPGVASAGISRQVQAILRGERLHLNEVRVPRNSIGQETWQNIRGVALRRGPEIIGGVLIREDVTERRQARESIRHSEERYRSLFTAQLDAFALHEIVRDPHGQPADYRFLAVNPAFEQLTGLDAAYILQRTVRDLFPHIDELWLGLYAQVALDGQAMRFEKYNPDLGRHIEINAYSPQPGQLAMLIRDVTERHKTARELSRAKAAAEAANKAKAEFLANMSHELRTPLNGVLGMLQLLDGDPSIDNEHKMLLETALESGRGLLTIINDILSFAQLDAGRLTIARAPADLREIADSVCRGFRYEAQDRGIALAYTVDEATPSTLLSDAGRLRQILMNLVSNAMKFTPGGRIEVGVQVLPRTPSPAERVLLLSVADTGIGIPDDKQAAVFEPFTQVDGSLTRKYQGTGIGLGIVRHLAQLMGGSVCLESAAGAGAAFYVTVRCGWAPHRAEDREPDAAPTPGLAGLRVLIAEDDRVNMLTALRFLERLGCAATPAGNGREALERLAAGEFDCILMDVQMPVLDGFEAARAIRASADLGAKARIPIVAMTAHALAEDRQRCLAAGMDGYISKPVDMDELARVLAEAVARGRERTAN